jgi:hypothetical protein
MEHVSIFWCYLRLLCSDLQSFRIFEENKRVERRLALPALVIFILSIWGCTMFLASLSMTVVS